MKAHALKIFESNKHKKERFEKLNKLRTDDEIIHNYQVGFIYEILLGIFVIVWLISMVINILIGIIIFLIGMLCYAPSLFYIFIKNRLYLKTLKIRYKEKYNYDYSSKAK